jgi:hypothetical protein
MGIVGIFTARSRPGRLINGSLESRLAKLSEAAPQSPSRWRI